MKRRDFIKTAGLGLISLAAGCQTLNARSPKRPPNIIFILADDLGYGDLGCYGQKIVKTPNIDKMADEGMRFTDHYAGSTVCAPSRCSLMTGYHTGHTFVRGNKEVQPEGQAPIPADTVTVAKLLKKAGYRTACIGKWGMGYPGSEGEPNKQGFDYFYGYNCQRQAHLYYPEYLWRNTEKVPLKGNNNGKRTTYSHDLLAREAMTWILSNASHPFFLYLPFTIPHAEMLVPQDSFKPYQGKFPETPYDKGNYHYASQPAPYATLAGMISRMDGDIGKIFDLLKKLDLDDNTIVFFASDNGPHKEGGIRDVEVINSNGIFKGAKRDLYEGGIRVPMIVRWPGKIKAGSTSDLPSAFWDVLPTLTDLAGTQAPQGIDGISFLPELLHKSQPRHKYLYWEFHELGGRQAVRLNHWKGVRLNVKKNPNGPIELYDLKKDPGETNNIASQHPDIVQQIARIMKEEHTESPEFPFLP